MPLFLETIYRGGPPLETVLQETLIVVVFSATDSQGAVGVKQEHVKGAWLFVVVADTWS